MLSELKQFVEEVLLEYKPIDIISMTGNKVTSRASSRPSTLSRVDRTNNVWNFRVSGGEEIYTVKIKISGKPMRTIGDSDVFVTCNCPAFRWQGSEYWAKTGDYLFQKPAGTASEPHIRDPNADNTLCKHCVSALQKASNILL